MTLTPKQRAEGVAAHLRGVGPQTFEDIRTSLGMTKRETEHALWLLGAKTELVFPYTSPLTYKVTTEEAQR